MTDVMIETRSLGKQFGSVRALDDVSFEVRKGEVVGFLGPNGAGKSTTMRILTCFISPSTGSASVHGFDVFSDPLAVRQRLGYLPQRAPLYTDMKVWDYLEFASQIRQMDTSTFKNRLKKVVEVCGLNQVLGKPINNLSHGYRQRVGLGQALIHDPPILILDEPTSDLDPNEKAELLKYIKLIGKDRTILLSTHNLGEVEEACGRAIIVSKGRVVADGALADIRRKTGGSQYSLVVDDQGAEGSHSAPAVGAVRDALEGLKGAQSVSHNTAAGTGHRFDLSSDDDTDLRASLFRLTVDQGWTLLELRREQQSLDSVFRDLTRGDEKLDRGADWQDGADADQDQSDSDTDSDKEEN